jgi:alpha-tubulin suppressor-like RCC1 family protein
MHFSRLAIIAMSFVLAACSQKDLSLIFEKSTTEDPSPRQELAIKQLSGGSTHFCALIEDGVKCWGSNNYGQIGNNTTMHVGV